MGDERLLSLTDCPVLQNLIASESSAKSFALVCVVLLDSNQNHKIIVFVKILNSHRAANPLLRTHNGPQ